MWLYAWGVPNAKELDMRTTTRLTTIRPRRGWSYLVQIGGSKLPLRFDYPRDFEPGGGWAATCLLTGQRYRGIQAHQVVREF